VRKHPAFPYVLLTFCALFWAGSSVVGRHVAGEVPPISRHCPEYSNGYLQRALACADNAIACLFGGKGLTLGQVRGRASTTY
jgi:hypothetical protein